jgi:hypothetical protein
VKGAQRSYLAMLEPIQLLWALLLPPPVLLARRVATAQAAQLSVLALQAHGLLLAMLRRLRLASSAAWEATALEEQRSARARLALSAKALVSLPREAAQTVQLVASALEGALSLHA